MSETTGTVELTPEEKAYLLACFKIGNLMMKSTGDPIARMVMMQWEDIYREGRQAIINIIGVPVEVVLSGQADHTEMKDKLNASVLRIRDSIA